MIQIMGLLAASAVLITLSMLFSISESSFLAMNKLRLRILRQKKDKRALRAGKLLDKKEILINTLLVANDLVNILLSSIITAVALKLFGKNGVGIATFIVTLLLLIFGEITPKTISTKNPDTIAYTLSLFVTVVVKILRPIVIVFTFVSRIVLKLRGINTQKEKQTYSEEDIKSFIDAGAETGVLEDGEKSMMNRVFRYTDLSASDIMVPRTDITALKLDSSYNDVIGKAQKTHFAHFPVYKKNIDDIVGILYLKDLLKIQDAENTFSLEKVMRPPLFVLGTKKISSVQQLLRATNQSFAIVIDEYSGTDGIISQSDIVREIFGTGGTKAYYSENGSFNMDGTTLLSEINDLLGIKLTSRINETFGGWIVEKLDNMPAAGNSIIYNGFKFTILNLDGMRIKDVHIEKYESGVVQ